MLIGSISPVFAASNPVPKVGQNLFEEFGIVDFSITEIGENRFKTSMEMVLDKSKIDYFVSNPKFDVATKLIMYRLDGITKENNDISYQNTLPLSLVDTTTNKTVGTVTFAPTVSDRDKFVIEFDPEALKGMYSMSVKFSTEHAVFLSTNNIVKEGTVEKAGDKGTFDYNLKVNGKTYQTLTSTYTFYKDATSSYADYPKVQPGRVNPTIDSGSRLNFTVESISYTPGTSFNNKTEKVTIKSLKYPIVDIEEDKEYKAYRNEEPSKVTSVRNDSYTYSKNSPRGSLLLSTGYGSGPGESKTTPYSATGTINKTLVNEREVQFIFYQNSDDQISKLFNSKNITLGKISVPFRDIISNMQNDGSVSIKLGTATIERSTGLETKDLIFSKKYNIPNGVAVADYFKIDTIVEEEVLNFKTIYEDDPTLLKGETKVKTPGVNGKKTSTVEVLYGGGVELERNILDVTIQEPKDQVILRGTMEGEYTVSFNTQGGSTIPSQQVTGGTTATRPQDPTKYGYIFDDWYIRITAWQERIFNFSTLINADTFLYAKWTPIKHEVVFDTQGGSSIAKRMVTHDTTTIRPANPRKDGAIFKGWYTAASGGTVFDFTKPITAATTIYAQWTTLTQPAAPTRTNYTFKGWFTTATGTTPFDFSQPITNETTIYAQWTPINHTLTFNTQGGSAVPSQTLLQGTVPTEPTAPTRTNYTFKGWFTTATGTTPFDFTKGLAASATAFAQWTPINHTLTFDTQGGSAIAPQTLLQGTAPTKPADPTRANYTFKGWFTTATGTTPFDFTKGLTGAATAFAQWNPINHTLTFNTQGGSTVPAQTLLQGTAPTKPAEPTRTGYTFKDWFTTASGTAIYDFTKGLTAPVTIFAQWIPVKKTVVIEKNETVEGTPIPGAQYQITGTDIEGNNINKTITTNSNGELIVEDLLYGEYIIKETSTPKGYIPDTKTHTLMVADNITLNNTNEMVILTDIAKVSFNLYTETTSGVRLEGAEFTFKNSEGEEVTLTSDINGQLKFKDILMGDYTLTHIKAPQGYRILPKPIKITADLTSSMEGKEINETNNTIIIYSSAEELPNTGTLGMIPFLAGGLTIVGIGGFIVAKSMKKNKDDDIID